MVKVKETPSGITSVRRALSGTMGSTTSCRNKAHRATPLRRTPFPETPTAGSSTTPVGTPPHRPPTILGLDGVIRSSVPIFVVYDQTFRNGPDQRHFLDEFSKHQPTQCPHLGADIGRDGRIVGDEVTQVVSW
jgi:hypothetical protein